MYEATFPVQQFSANFFFCDVWLKLLCFGDWIDHPRPSAYQRDKGISFSLIMASSNISVSHRGVDLGGATGGQAKKGNSRAASLGPMGTSEKPNVGRSISASRANVEISKSAPSLSVQGPLADVFGGDSNTVESFVVKEVIAEQPLTPSRRPVSPGEVPETGKSPRMSPCQANMVARALVLRSGIRPDLHQGRSK